MCRRHRHIAVITPPWDEPAWNWEPGEDDRSGIIGKYFVEVTTQLWQQTLPHAYEFQICWGDLRRLHPHSQRPMVIIHRGDERSGAYSYPPEAVAVFREYGRERRQAGFQQLTASGGPVALAQEFARDCLASLAKARLRTRKVVPVPIGYSNPIESSVPRMDGRSIDVYFAGSFQHRRTRSLRDRIDPKWNSRMAMRHAVSSLGNQGRANVQIDETAFFGAAVAADRDRYRDRLGNSKIALAPRGTSLETFRHFEAAMAGCVVITEPLPKTWYFADHPFVVVQSWRHASRAIRRLLDDPERLQDISAATLAWWNRVASPSALATRVRRELIQLDRVFS